MASFTVAVTAAESIIGYDFNRPEKLAMALNGSGNPQLFRGQWVKSNKELAIYGDAVMTARLAFKYMRTNSSRDGLPMREMHVLTLPKEAGTGFVNHFFAIVIFKRSPTESTLGR